MTHDLFGTPLPISGNHRDPVRPPAKPTAQRCGIEPTDDHTARVALASPMARRNVFRSRIKRQYRSEATVTMF
jgi:hypothetical protein